MTGEAHGGIDQDPGEGDLGVGLVVLLRVGKTTFAGLEFEKGLQASSLLQRDGGLLENIARLDKPNMVDLKISLVLILLCGLLTVQDLTELKPSAGSLEYGGHGNLDRPTSREY